MFNEKKATQVAAQFLQRAGGEMEYVKLIKLMYLAERRSITEWGRPLTGDRCVAMDHGPVLSQTYDLIDSPVPPVGSSPWHRNISDAPGHAVYLEATPGTDELSPVEENVIDEIQEEYGHHETWDLVKLLHDTLPEWEDPNGSRYDISYRDMLEAVGADDKVIKFVEEDIRVLNKAERMLGQQKSVVVSAADYEEMQRAESEDTEPTDALVELMSE